MGIVAQTDPMTAHGEIEGVVCYREATHYINPLPFDVCKKLEPNSVLIVTELVAKTLKQLDMFGLGQLELFGREDLVIVSPAYRPELIFMRHDL